MPPRAYGTVCRLTIDINHTPGPPALLRAAHMLPAGRTVWPDLPPLLIGP